MNLGGHQGAAATSMYPQNGVTSISKSYKLLLLQSSGMMMRCRRFYIAAEETAITADGIERIPKNLKTKT